MKETTMQKLTEHEVTGLDALRRLQDLVIDKLARHGSVPVTWQSMKAVIDAAVAGTPPDADDLVRPKKQRPVYDVAEGYEVGSYVKGVGYIGGSGRRAASHIHREIPGQPEEK
jgi:hypothetical protein